MSRVPPRARVRPSVLPRPAIISSSRNLNARRAEDAAATQHLSHSHKVHSDSVKSTPTVNELTGLHLGTSVLVDGVPGLLRFVGGVHFASGEWCGVELRRPIGKNDGSVNGKRYFTCRNSFGLFAPIRKVVRQGRTSPTSIQRSASHDEDRSTLTVNSRSKGANHSAEVKDDGNDANALHSCSSSDTSSKNALTTSATPSVGSAELWWDSDVDLTEGVELLEDVVMEEPSLDVLSPYQDDDENMTMTHSFQSVVGQMDSHPMSFAFDASGPPSLGAHKPGMLGECSESAVNMSAIYGEPHFSTHRARKSTAQNRLQGESCSYDIESVCRVVEGGREEIADSLNRAVDLVHMASPASDVSILSCSHRSSTSSSANDHPISDRGHSDSGNVFDNSAEVLVMGETAHASEASAKVDCGELHLRLDFIGSDPHRDSQETVSSAASAVETDGQSLSTAAKPRREPQVVETRPDAAAAVSDGAAIVSVDEVGYSSAMLTSRSIDGGYHGDTEYDTGTLSECAGGRETTRTRCEQLTDSDFCSEGAAAVEDVEDRRLVDVEMESSGVFSDVESRRSVETTLLSDETVEVALSPVKETFEDEPVSDATLTPMVMSTTTALSDATLNHSELADDACVPTWCPAVGAGGDKEVDTVATRGTEQTDGKTHAGQTVPSGMPGVSGQTSVSGATKNITRSTKRQPLKMNHPLPRRDVQSKLHAVIHESSTSAGDAESSAVMCRQQRPCKKGRWHSVMSQIEQGRQDQRHRPKKEVKSRLMDGVVTARSRRNSSLRHADTNSVRSLCVGDVSRSSSGSVPNICGVGGVSGSAGSRSVSPSLSGDESASDQDPPSMASRASLGHQPASSNRLARPSATRKHLTGSCTTLVNSRSLIPTIKNSAGRSSPSRRNDVVPAAATKGALASTSRRTMAKSAAAASNPKKPANSATNTVLTQSQCSNGNTTANASRIRANKATKQSPKEGGVGAGSRASRVPPDASSSAAAEQRVRQLERQLSSCRLQLAAAGGQLTCTARGFDAAITLVDYLANQCNAFTLATQLHESLSRCTSLQLALDEAAAYQLQLNCQLAECERRGELNQQLHDQQLQQERDSWQLQRDQLQEECRQLQLSNQQLHDSCQQLRDTPPPSHSVQVQTANTRTQQLQHEVHSLQQVLELKAAEMTQARQQLQQLAELKLQLARLQERCDQHRQRAEDLNEQLNTRAAAERRLVDENRRIRDSHERDTCLNRRLSMENEQLQYRLRTQLSDSPHHHSGGVMRSSSFRSSSINSSFSRSFSESPHQHAISGVFDRDASGTNDSAAVMSSSLHNDPRCTLAAAGTRRRASPRLTSATAAAVDVSASPSPPPLVHAVVEKCDSISYVLQLDETSALSSAAPEADAQAAPLTVADHNTDPC